MFIIALALAGVTACSNDSTATTQKSKRGVKAGAHLVEVATITSKDLVHPFERTGTLRALNEARIFSQEDGAVLEVPVREGDKVNVGDILVRLDDRLLAAELAQAVARRKQLASDVVRLQRLSKKNLATEDALAKAVTELEVAQAAERLLQTRHGYMTITAPFPGTVAERLVNPGDIAPKHRHLITVVDPTALVTDVHVSELLLPGLRNGDPVTVRIDALGERTINGRIRRIYPTVDPKTRRGQIEIVLDEVPAQARSGQFCRVSLSSRRKDARLVPLAAMRRDDRGEYVYVVEQQRVRRHTVHSGVRLAIGVELVQGPPVGATVVTAGFLGLREGDAVRTSSVSANTDENKSGPAANRAREPG